MKAIVYDKKGSPEKLVCRDVDKPVPDENEVLIKIRSASVNAADYRSMRMGLIPKRKIFGADIAGCIESVGINIKRFKPGDEVFGDLAGYGFGGFAEYVTAPERLLAKKPAGITFEEAASIPIAGLTALQALRSKGNVQNGQKVLIVGSSGGVGTYAVQLAKYFGAEVTGVCSTRNAEQTRALGADYIIDYTKENFTRTSNRYNLILAINGNRSLYSYTRILAPGGICVMVGGSMKQIFSFILFGWMFSFGSKKMKFLSARANAEDLESIAALVREGKIKAVIEKRYTLDKTAEALKYISEGHACAKIVIVVEP